MKHEEISGHVVWARQQLDGACLRLADFLARADEGGAVWQYRYCQLLAEDLRLWQRRQQESFESEIVGDGSPEKEEVWTERCQISWERAAAHLREWKVTPPDQQQPRGSAGAGD